MTHSQELRQDPPECLSTVHASNHSESRSRFCGGGRAGPMQEAGGCWGSAPAVSSSVLTL